MLERIGNCRIIGEIASGGMAVVYKAVQESLNRTVAVKALKTSVAADPQFATRFEREALSLAGLQHENIIHVYDFYKERGAYFIVMEYVEGVDLYDLMDKCGRLPLDVAAIIAMQVARALDYAHYRGIIHRDIKPANMMISQSGGVKLMDFGIARDQAFGDLTQTGTGLGTPSYMSPEQILGDKLDFRSDIFSLGIVLYQMCTGRKPFIEDEQKSVMHKIRLEKHPNPRKLNPEIPRELERIMSRCMQKVPRDRWRSTQDLVLALERYLARRVEMNYHARLVQYLKNTGIVTPEQAEEYLHPTGQPGTVPTASRPGRDLVRRISTIEAMIVGGVALTIGLIHLAPVGAKPNVQGAQLAGAPIARPHGKLRIVANPWAEVWVDGKLADTTPIAGPLDLEAGAHQVKLRNPFFAELDREVEVNGDDDEPIVFTLSGRKTTARPPDPPTLHNEIPIETVPAIEHDVKKGDTLDLLAAEYYGTRDFAFFIMVANGMPAARPLRPGEQLSIPTAWKYRIVDGDTFATLAKRYLGDERRGPFLADFNHQDSTKPLAPGDELTIPYHAGHVAAKPEDLADVAVLFYHDKSKATMLQDYNFLDANKLTKGQSIVVPIIDVKARVPEDPDAERKARKTREMMVRAKEALPHAQESWKEGDYAGSRQILLTLEPEFLEPEASAEVEFLLGSTYVALGDKDSAQRELKHVLERRPEFAVRPDETSPKICDAWRAAGGKVMDLKPKDP